MPMTNWWSARQNEPTKKIRYAKGKFGKGIDAVFNVGLAKGPKGGKSQLQTIRFDKSLFNKGRAKDWLKKHGFKTMIESGLQEVIARVKKLGDF
jgi:hypothetical protein